MLYQLSKRNIKCGFKTTGQEKLQMKDLKTSETEGQVAIVKACRVEITAYEYVLICINMYNFNTSLIIKNTLKYWRAIICVTENCYQVLQPLLYLSVLNYILASSKTTNKQNQIPSWNCTCITAIISHLQSHMKQYKV